MIQLAKEYLESASSGTICLVSVMLIGILGAIDYATGNEISFSIFYLAPIAIAGWYTNRNIAIVISIVSAAVWMEIDLLTGNSYSRTWIPLWNTSVRLGFFIIMVLLLQSIKNYIKRELLLSHTDSLTGINNQRAFKELLTQYLFISSRFRHSLVLGYIDLDNFKYVNDNMGHSIGDVVLSKVGAILSSTVRATDIVGRIGGDEFTVLLPNTDCKGATQLFYKLHRVLLSEMKHNSWPVGFSIGVAVFTSLPKDGDEALRIADEIMYQVKRSSKNRIMCHEITKADPQ